ncbi:hypothetical protein C1T28_21780, partial [Bacillus subtilis]
SEEDLIGYLLITKKFSNEESKESEVHTEIIEILLNLLLLFMSSDEYFFFKEEEYIIVEQVVWYIGVIMKLNVKLFAN